MIKALIVDDHRLMRGGMKSLLAETGDIRLIGEVSNSEETLRSLVGRAVDVVLLDISMPGESGITMLRTLSSQHPHIPVIVCTYRRAVWHHRASGRRVRICEKRLAI